MAWPILKSKNIAVFSNVPLWINRHPEGIEIVWRYRDSNQTHWIFCDGGLASCPANSFHESSLCLSCTKQTNYTKTKLLPKETFLHIYRPEAVRLSTSDLPSSFVELLDFRYRDVPIGGMVVSQLADDFRDRHFEWPLIETRALAILVSAIELYDWSHKFFIANSITTAFVWNGRRPSDGPMTYAAKHLGLQLFTMISDEPGKLRLVPDVSVQSSKGLEQALSEVRGRNLSSSDEMTASDLLGRFRYGSNTDRTLPWFARRQTKAFQKLGSKPLLVIFTSSPFEHIGLEEFAVAGDLRQNVFETNLEDICSRPSITLNWQVVIRFHPNLVDAGPFERDRIKRLRREFPDVTVFEPEADVSSYSLIDQAEVVVSFGSTIGIEASWYGKPSLLVGKAFHENCGVCIRVKSIDELEMLLNKNDFTVVKKEKITQYFVAERSTHLLMEHVQVNPNTSRMLEVPLEYSSLFHEFRVHGRWVLNIVFRLRRSMKRWRVLFSN